MRDKEGLLILDEFQDISLVAEAQGLMREALQSFGDTPMILMGSKKHLLGAMFGKPEAPFADFGTDIEFGDIPYDEYREYILERFRPSGLSLSEEVSKTWQDLLFRNAEAINNVGAHLVERFRHKKIEERDVRLAIDAVVEERGSRFEEILTACSPSDERVLVAIARRGPIPQPSSKKFLAHLNLAHATVNKCVRRLWDGGFIEKTTAGYRLSNPLLHYFVLKHR